VDREAARFLGLLSLTGLLLGFQGAFALGPSNLLVNSGAEDGLAHWTIVQGDPSSAQGGRGFPDPKGGQSFFWAGNSGFSSMFQTVDISNFSSMVDSDSAFLLAGGWVRDYLGRDMPRLRVEALDAGDQVLENLTTGSIREGSWHLYRLTSRLRAGTRKIRFWVESTMDSGPSNDGYFDDLFVYVLGEPPSIEAPSIITGPYLQNFSSTGIVVMWETDRPTNSAVVYRSVGSDRWVWRNDTSRVKMHEVALRGLETGLRYEYRVVSGQAQSGIHSFELNFQTPYRFAVYGDSRTVPSNHRKIVEGMIQYTPDFVVNTGDVVESGNSYPQWRREHFGPLQPLAANVTTYVAIGNHERDSHWFNDYVCQPGNEHYFAFTYANSRFIFLDSNWPYYPGTPQYAWLKQELCSEDYLSANFRFVFFHHPPFSDMWDSPGYIGDAAVRKYIVPLLEAAKVDIVFNGHTHDYERGKRPVGDGDGTYYVITGGGGSPLDTTVTHDWEHVSIHRSVYHFCILDVGDYNLTLRSIGMDGDLIDSFCIDKAKSKPDLEIAEMTFDRNKSLVLLTVANSGFVASPPFHVALKCNGTAVGTLRVQGLEAHRKARIEIPWEPTTPGYWTLNATVDPEDSVDEGTWEGNNEASQAILIPASLPDLVVRGMRVLGEIAVGKPVEVLFSVGNLGERASPPSVLRACVNGTPVSSTAVPALLPGDSFNGTFEFTPDTGALFVINATIDPGNQIPEVSEDNSLLADLWVVDTLDFSPAHISNPAPRNRTLVVKYDEESGALGRDLRCLFLKWAVNGWTIPAGGMIPPGSLRMHAFVETPMHKGPDGLWTVTLPISDRIDEVDFLFEEWFLGDRRDDDNDGRCWVWINPAQYYEARDSFRALLLEAMGMGLNASNFSTVLTEADDAAHEGDYLSALGTLEKWTGVLGSSVVERMIQNAWTSADRARQQGMDVSRVETYLEAAESRLKLGTWSYAKGYAENAQRLLKEMELPEPLLFFAICVVLMVALKPRAWPRIPAFRRP